MWDDSYLLIIFKMSRKIQIFYLFLCNLAIYIFVIICSLYLNFQIYYHEIVHCVIYLLFAGICDVSFFVPDIIYFCIFFVLECFAKLIRFFFSKFITFSSLLCTCTYFGCNFLFFPSLLEMDP